MIMAHLSHVYSDGGSLYFTFVAPLKGLQKSEKLYDLIWDIGMKKCHEMGGVISHHHGIGKLKAKYMVEEWGDGAALFKTFKDLYDPHRIMNPCKLYVFKKDKKLKEEAA
jgi:alkyldihydroxyacetonephosphate synthase